MTPSECLVGSMVRLELLKQRRKMFLWILFLVTTTSSAPAEEYQAIVNEGEFLNDASVMQIVPSGFSPQKTDYFIKPSLAEVVDKDKPSYKRMIDILNKGHTKLGLIFNIFDDNMREATIALYRLLLDVGDDKFDAIERWSRVNINKDMFDYAWRLASLYGNKFKKEELLPPFIKKPNHFVNSEAMWKAMHIKIGNGDINDEDGQLNQYYRSDDVITINTNYSGWNLPQNGCDREINYFKEDIALNSYYYGVHLLHPFWMSNDELDLLNPRHAEHYYFTHKQLMARYQLEMEHLKKDNNGTSCDINLNSYNSYLMHDYGLPFPIKSSIKEWNEGRARLKSIDIAIRECISRGLLVDSNGTTIPIAGEYNIDLISKLVRANLDGIKSVKVIRSIYGYGGNGYPIDQYNPAPSVLHFPQTSLRDHTYWHLINSLLEYFTEYKKTLDSYSLAQYHNKNLAIVDNNFNNITTYFEYFKFSLNKGLGGGLRSPLVFTARQRRLNHLPFTLNFTLDSTAETDVIVRLFLGPLCNVQDCWLNCHKFFELDVYKTKVKHGLNTISWSPDTSERFSSDEYYNLEASKKQNNKFNLFKFPKNLVIPKGSEQGLDMTIFIMVTQADLSPLDEVTPRSNYYNQVLSEIDKKPLGFPFHRQALIEDECGSNYKFYNVTIYYENRPVDTSGYFSPNLY